MSLHYTRPDRPVDATLVAVTGYVQSAAMEIGIDCMLVGATARDLLLTNVFGLSVRRATADVDFGVAVRDWPQFDRLKLCLIESGHFQADVDVQKLHYVANGRRALPLDLIPFGAIADGKVEIAWPPDMAVIMNVAGYEEAYAHSDQLALPCGSEIRVASIPGLAILKLIAWADRGRADNRDAIDLYQLLSNYAQAGNLDRLYGGEQALLEAAAYDPDLAGIRLLGKDVAHTASAASLVQLRSILDEHLDRLVGDIARSTRSTNPGELVLQLEQFRLGLSSSN